MTGKGLDELVSRTAAEVRALRSAVKVENDAESSVALNQGAELMRRRRDAMVSIKSESTGIWRVSIKSESAGIWRVSGGAVERMVIQTDWDNDEAIAYLQHRFDRIGLDDRLAAAGCKNGDEVRILGYSFTYEGSEDEDDFDELDDADDTMIDGIENVDADAPEVEVVEVQAGE